MKLIYESTGEQVRVGDEVTLDDGCTVTVTHFREPHKPSSSGKVCVMDRGTDSQREYYVSVIGARWINREDRPLETAAEVRAAVDLGLDVRAGNDNYRVIKDSIGQYLIHFTGHPENWIGLTGREGTVWEDQLNMTPIYIKKAEERETDYLDEIAIIFDAAEDWRNELAEYIEPGASDEEKETRLAERHALEDALTTFAPLVAMIRRDRA